MPQSKQEKAIHAKNNPAMEKHREIQRLLAKTSGKMGITKEEIKALKEKGKKKK